MVGTLQRWLQAIIAISIVACVSAVSIVWAEPTLQDQVRFLEARRLLEQGRTAEGAQALAELTTLQDDPAVAIELSRAWVATGKREAGLGALARALRPEVKLSATDRSRLLERYAVLARVFVTQEGAQSYQDGVYRLKQGKYEDAKTALESALQKEPLHPLILLRLGQVALLDQRVEAAGRSLIDADRWLNPAGTVLAPETFIWLGQMSQRIGRSREALELFERAERWLADSERMLIWKGQAIAATGQRARAIEYLEQRVRSRPTHVSALVELARLRLAAPAGVAAPERSALLLARKELQLALTRAPDYFKLDRSSLEGDLGVDWELDEARFRSSIAQDLERIESRLLSREQLKPDGS